MEKFKLIFSIIFSSLLMFILILISIRCLMFLVECSK